MGALSDKCDEDKSSPSLTEDEKEEVKRKRLEYLSTKYPPQKPLDPSRKIFKREDQTQRRHEMYIKDLLG